MSKIFVLLMLGGFLTSVASAKPADKKMRDVASIAKEARKVTCNFTEPFFTVEVNFKRKVMKVESPMGELMEGKLITQRTDEVEDVAFSVSHGVWSFVAGDAKIPVLTVNTGKKGSDGMSDKVFDAEGVSTLFSGSSHPNGDIGGCNFSR